MKKMQSSSSHKKHSHSGHSHASSKESSSRSMRETGSSKDMHREKKSMGKKPPLKEISTPTEYQTNQAEGQIIERPFKDSHHALIKAIWNVDRLNPNVHEKLKELRHLVIDKKCNLSIECDILHDITGQPIAQATPLLIACFEGDADVIKFLIENGADPNQTESEHHLSALHVISDAEYHGQTLRQKDRAEICRMLLKRGANPNHLDRSSMAAIHKAVLNDRPECVDALMEGRADPNVAYLGDTPISIAARHNRDRIVKILCNYKETNLNHRNEQGGTPLHFACAAIVDTPNCVELLVRHGAKVNSQDLKLNTPLMVTSFFNKPNIMKFLIREGADITFRNYEDKDAYDISCEREFQECKDLLGKAIDRQQKLDQRETKSTEERSSNNLATDFESKTRLRN